MDSSLPPRKPSKGRKLAMRSYSLSFQTPAPASPPSKWTPALLEQSPPPPPAACRGETLPKAKSVAAIPNVATSSSFTVAAAHTLGAADLAVLSPGGKSSPTRKRPGKNSKKPKRSEAVFKVTEEDDRRLEASAGSSAGKRRLEAASSTAEMEIERFEREFLHPLLETTSQHQQLARLQISCGDLPATTAVVTTASAAVEYHRDLRYQKCYIHSVQCNLQSFFDNFYNCCLLFNYKTLPCLQKFYILLSRSDLAYV